MVKGFSIVITVAQVQSLAWELLHVVGVAKKKKKKKEGQILKEITKGKGRDKKKKNA